MTPILIMTLQQNTASLEAIEITQKELNRMARLADNWVKHVKEMEREI